MRGADAGPAAGEALDHGQPETLGERGVNREGASGVGCGHALVRERTEYDYAFRKTYLGGNIRYDLGPAEKRGVERFVELLRLHQPRPVHAPRYVA